MSSSKSDKKSRLKGQAKQNSLCKSVSINEKFGYIYNAITFLLQISQFYAAFHIVLKIRTFQNTLIPKMLFYFTYFGF